MRILFFIILYFFIYGSMNPTKYYITQLQILTFPLYFLYILLHTKNLSIFLKKGIIKIFLITLVMFFLHFFTKILNNDMFLFSGPFFLLPLKTFIKFTNAILLLILIKKIKEKKIEQIEYLFINIILAMSLDLSLGVIRYFFPSINNYLFLLNNIKGTYAESFLFLKNRLVAFGAPFFAGGALSSLGLLLIIYFQIKKERLKLWIFFIVFFLVGIFISRTIIIGFILSIFYYLENNKLKIKKYLKLIFIIISSIPLIFIFKNLEINSKMYLWAFEIFLKKGETASTNVLKRMWTVIPDKSNTWIFGDGKWVTETGRYYMHTDVGYLRILWYLGLIGIILFLIFNFSLYIFTKKYANNKIRILNKYFLILCLIMNIKGYWEPYFIYYCLIVILIDCKEKYNNAKCCNECI